MELITQHIRYTNSKQKNMLFNLNTNISSLFVNEESVSYFMSVNTEALLPLLSCDQKNLWGSKSESMPDAGLYFYGVLTDL